MDSCASPVVLCYSIKDIYTHRRKEKQKKTQSKPTTTNQQQPKKPPQQPGKQAPRIWLIK